VPAAEADGRPAFATEDPADDAMVARARERFAGERSRLERRQRRAERHGALPNLIVIGGLKCGTTSLHHYLNLHPQVAMSRPKELNFFVAELNWDLGADWYASHFDRSAPVRGETSPHYTNLPRFGGVAGRMREVLGADVRVIYMVRDPIDRMLSHYLHNVGGGYESRPLETALSDPNSAYVARSRYAMQAEPYLEAFGAEGLLIVTREELRDDRLGTMGRTFGFCGVDAGFTSPQFEREWETGGGKQDGGFRLMDRAVRLPGLRSLDRNFDRLPESLRWLVERIVHDPERGAAPKPELPDELRARLRESLAEDTARLDRIAGRKLGYG
jgi:Sulfotransferase domain